MTTGTANIWTANNYGTLVYQSTCSNIPADLTFYLPAERNIYHSCIGVLFFKCNRRLAYQQWSVWCFLGHAFPIFLGLCVATLCAGNWNENIFFPCDFLTSQDRNRTDGGSELQTALLRSEVSGKLPYRTEPKTASPLTLFSPKISDKFIIHLATCNSYYIIM